MTAPYICEVGPHPIGHALDAYEVREEIMRSDHSTRLPGASIRVTHRFCREHADDYSGRYGRKPDANQGSML